MRIQWLKNLCIRAYIAVLLDNAFQLNKFLESIKKLARLFAIVMFRMIDSIDSALSFLLLLIMNSKLTTKKTI